MQTISELEEKLKTIPTNPGCYIYRDRNNRIIYIGKAKNLKKRVMQYFMPYVEHEPRIEQMISKIRDVEYHIVDTELEALVLEANLIKKYRPKYNVLMKDDKSYTWIKITTKEEYPRVTRIRDKDKKDDGNTYFGPYPDSRTVYNILRVLRKVFPFRTCDYDIKETDDVKKSRLCLYYHLGLCSGPCDHIIGKAAYRKQIQHIIRFLRGENKTIINEFKAQMLQYAQELEFEKAGILRDKINDMLYITQKISITSGVDEHILEKKREFIISTGLSELFEKTGAIGENNYRMECYDISNIQGTNPVGAMVVFENGIAKKNDYRKFKIRGLNTPNDFAMMKEMLERRFNNFLNPERKDTSFKSKPDLIIIDGGKGQLSTAFDVLTSFDLAIPIVGLAKREELIFFPNNSIPLKLKRDSNALYLMQRIRDEAHRFGITFHRDLRSKQALVSPFDSIPGIGKKTKERLLKRFTTFESARRASDDELKAILNTAQLKNLRQFKERS